MTNRIAPDLLASIRAHQHAPDEVPPPAKVQHPGVKYNARFERGGVTGGEAALGNKKSPRWDDLLVC